MAEEKKTRRGRKPKVVDEPLIETVTKPVEEEPKVELAPYTVIYTGGINLRTKKPADVAKTFGEGDIITVMPEGSKFYSDKSEGKWLHGTFEKDGNIYGGWACGNNGIWLKKV